MSLVPKKLNPGKAGLHLFVPEPSPQFFLTSIPDMQ